MNQRPIVKAPNSHVKIVIVANDVVGERMAGPGIRAWELARVLSREFDVILALPPVLEIGKSLPEPDFPLRIESCRRPRQLRQLATEADVILTLGALLPVYPFLARTSKPLVVDAYDPYLLAGLEQHREIRLKKRLSIHEGYHRAHLLSMKAADLILCASEKQRDYWLGMLSAVGRVNPFTHDEDPTLRRLIDVVPFGLSRNPPTNEGPLLKGVVPGVGTNDKVVLWGGGIWNWLDAPTAIRAMALVVERNPNAKLFFMGTERPNPKVAKMSAVEEAVELSRRLDLFERSVFFNDWVPYSKRQNYLLEADVGISLHRSALEARFAFRTRILDYFWAGLPIVTTEGDVLADEVRRARLGRIVPPEDEKAVAAALLELFDLANLKKECAPRFEAKAAEYRWDAVAEPLVRFCREPRRAPDKATRMRPVGGFLRWWKGQLG